MSWGRHRPARVLTLAWGLGRPFVPASPAVSLGGIVGLMGAVTLLRWYVDGAGQAAALLYVVPIALSALRYGRRGGVATAGVGITAFIVLELVRSRGDIDATGWMGPILAMALIGGLVGQLSESAARSSQAADGLQALHLRELSHAHHAAAEASDSLVQRVAAARWMLEAGKNQEALAALNATVTEGIPQVSRALAPLSPRATGYVAPRPDPGPASPGASEGERSTDLGAPRIV